MSSKPPYLVPPMAEIARGIGSNGLSVVSTFSGCGGSCLGLEMAGYRVLWANEFIEAARDTYRLNHPGVTLDERDIRTVTASDVLDATGLAPGELDLLEGSPPCSAFSTAGKREKGWGKTKKYSDSEQRVDDLFFEYVRLLDGLRPRAFIAENVSGLVKGDAYGYFEMIISKMRSCGYRVRAKVLDAQWLGVPQARKRLIFIGVRDDVPGEPAFPSPLPYRYSIRDAIPWVSSLRLDTRGIFPVKDFDVDVDVVSTITTKPHHLKMKGAEESSSLQGTAIGLEWKNLKPGETSDRYFNLVRPDAGEPCPTVTAIGGGRGVASVTHPSEPRKFTMRELRRLCGFPDDFQLTGTYTQQWERLGRSVPPPMMMHASAAVRDRILKPCAG